MSEPGDQDEDCTRQGCGHGYRWHDQTGNEAACRACPCLGFSLTQPEVSGMAGAAWELLAICEAITDLRGEETTDTATSAALSALWCRLRSVQRIVAAAANPVTLSFGDTLRVNLEHSSPNI